MAFECTSPNTVQGRSCCSATAGRSPGTRGGNSFAPSARPATTRGRARPTTVMPQTPEAVFYQLYFQKPGVAEAELEHDVRASIRRLLYSISGDAPPGARLGLVPRRGGLLSAAVDPDPLPGWLTEADVDVYTREFERTGFRGGLNWYRNIDRNWELLAPFSGARVTVPALFIAGDRDPVLSFPGSQAALDGMATLVPNLRKTLILEGCGHWTQQERPAEVNTAMLEFLRSL